MTKASKMGVEASIESRMDSISQFSQSLTVPFNSDDMAKAITFYRPSKYM